MDFALVIAVALMTALITAAAVGLLVSRVLKSQQGPTQAELRQQAGDAAREELLSASQILERSTESRLSANAQALTAQQQQANETFRALLAPIGETLKALDGKVSDLEKARVGAYAKLDEQVTGTQTILTSLMNETTTLSNALRRSDTRGRWGELQLRRILEMLNMNEGTDFHEQKQELGEGTGRPDFTIYLPGERVLYIDSKAPMSAYLDGVQETDLIKRTEKFTAHARSIKDHVTALKRRNYTDGENSLNYVVMFVPTESSLAAACEINPRLIEDAAKEQVILASPTALIALLNNISLLWQQEKQAKNSADIVREASELHGRLTVFIRHFAKVGATLTKTVDAYNDSIGSFDRKVMPAARKVAALGNFDGVIENIPHVDVKARASDYEPSLEAVPDSDVS